MPVSPAEPALVYDQPVLLVGDGWVDSTRLSEWAERHRIVALDGGAHQVRRLGLRPDVILGDLDSLRISEAEQTCPVYHLSDQNSTDFDKALRNLDAPLALAFGVLGDRLDHALATLSCLARHPMGPRTVLIGREDAVYYVDTPKHTLRLPIGARLSLWTSQPVTFDNSSGLLYPLDGLTLNPNGILGTSNSVTATQVRICKPANAPGYYLMIEVEHAVLP